MNKDTNQPCMFHTISELHKALGLPKPLHPMVSLVDYGMITKTPEELPQALILGFYKISYKKRLHGAVKYGQGYYDFDEGGLSFISPLQLISGTEESMDYSGYTLLFHPDFIRNTSISRNMKQYGFFDYAVSEALYLSDKEKETIISIFRNMEQELQSPIDSFSQDVMVSLIELVLNYSKRFYNRQFITRKIAHHDLLTKVEELLSDCFNCGDMALNGVPTVQFISDQLHVSPRYLSDMLKSLTGQNTQQHIHHKLIEKAKELLSTGNLNISEIAYQLGFEHPQSFNKLFKQKTNVTPVQFRQSFYS